MTSHEPAAGSKDLRLLIRVAPLILAAAVAGCGGTHRQAAPPAAPPSPPGQERLDEIAGQLTGFLGRDYAKDYAGVVVRPADHQVVVYRVAAAAPRLDDAVRRRFSSDQRNVRFAPARFSHAYLESVQTRIEADRAYWSSRGVTISTLGVSPTGADVEVGVTDPRQRSAVGERYRGLPVAAVTSNPVPLSH